MFDHEDLRLADFGQTRPFRRDPVTGVEELLTNHKDYSVKMGYVPPEFCSEHPFRATQHDLFACGVILYIMLVNEVPFTTANRAFDDTPYMRILRGEVMLLAREQCRRGDLGPGGRLQPCELCSTDPAALGGFVTCCSLNAESAAVITGLLQVAEHRLTMAQLLMMPWMQREPTEEDEEEEEPVGETDDGADCEQMGERDE
jgi:hypothetical protein